MSYVYTEQRPNLFTEEGVGVLLKVRAKVRTCLRDAGAVRAQEAWRGVREDTWLMLAVLDYLVELGEIREITDESTPAQHRVFVTACDL